MSKLFTIGLLLGLAVGPLVRAEELDPEPEKPVDTTSVTTGTQGSDTGEVNNIFKSMNRAAPQADPMSNDRGREYKAGDAENKSGQGKGAAIATGAALLARGVSLLPFPTTPQG